MSAADLVQQLLTAAGIEPKHVLDSDVARLDVHENRVIGARLVPGLHVDVDEQSDGVKAEIRVERGAKIAKPVHICFGLLPENGLQRIVLDIQMEEDSDASVLAHCTFPNAVNVTHQMDAEITVAPNARYSYFERHVHGPHGGVLVVPKAHVTLHDHARYKTEFELIKGRVGAISIDYVVDCGPHSVLDMLARIGGRGDDIITIRETGHLNGEYARAILQSNIALRDNARAEVYNTLKADANGASGHVDCKEIVQDHGIAKAVPIVEVNHPGAHVTHEAAIGSVDNKQLETLLARGLTEDEAVDLIIQGLLS